MSIWGEARVRPTGARHGVMLPFAPMRTRRAPSFPEPPTLSPARRRPSSAWPRSCRMNPRAAHLPRLPSAVCVLEDVCTWSELSGWKWGTWSKEPGHPRLAPRRVVATVQAPPEVSGFSRPLPALLSCKSLV